MAIYRRIDIRIWGDRKFRQLSCPKPSAQFLWIFLLTGPFTQVIPGIFLAGPAAISEVLGWTLGNFYKVFQELVDHGMAMADFEARLIWIPKAIRYNIPASPNVIKHWAFVWDEVPECDLKILVYRNLKSFFEEGTEAFLKAFLKTCQEPFAGASPIQDQESHEQQQKQVEFQEKQLEDIQEQ